MEIGFRHGIVEPVTFVEYVREKHGALTVVAPHVGVNVWVEKYTFNLKTDFGYRYAQHREEATQKDLLWTTQAQLFF